MAGGAVMAHDGWLYWSTMIPPGYQALTFAALYPLAPSPMGFLGSYRPTAMFRGKLLAGKEPKLLVQLVYGNASLPKYVESADNSKACVVNTSTDPNSPNGDTACQWKIVPNAMGGQQALYGLSGYNNFFNSYTWWMQIYNGELFVGTFDWSYLLFESLLDIAGDQGPTAPDPDLASAHIADTDAVTIPPEVIEVARQFEGADLLRIHDSNDPAYAVSLNGVGNFSNYGVRNMLQVGSALYIGTANPFNLLNPPVNADYENQLGGWELIRLKPTDAWYREYSPTSEPKQE
jgi:hypothetical protein